MDPSPKFFVGKGTSRRSFTNGFLDFDPKVNYYQTLNVSEAATDAEIKRAFYALAKKYHPDANKS